MTSFSHVMLMGNRECNNCPFSPACGLTIGAASICTRPLHIAARTGLVKVVQELVKRGADLSAKDCDG